MVLHIAPAASAEHLRRILKAEHVRGGGIGGDIGDPEHRGAARLGQGMLQAREKGSGARVAKTGRAASGQNSTSAPRWGAERRS